MSKNYDAIKNHYAGSDRKDIAAMMAPITDKSAWTEMTGFPYAGTYVFDVYECSNGCDDEEGTPGDYDVTVTVN